MMNNSVEVSHCSPWKDLLSLDLPEASSNNRSFARGITSRRFAQSTQTAHLTGRIVELNRYSLLEESSQPKEKAPFVQFFICGSE